MIQAVLDGRKTQTRRVIKPRKKNRADLAFLSGAVGKGSMADTQYEITHPEKPNVPCPYGKIGDRLWCKENIKCLNWAPYSGKRTNDSGIKIQYKADNNIKWVEYPDELKPRASERIYPKIYTSRYMPRWASRITLEITDIRVERVQDIKPEDCEAEGIQGETKASPMRGHPYELYHCQGLTYSQPVDAFKDLWDSINAKRGYSYESNLWVWVISFKMMKKEV